MNLHEAVGALAELPESQREEVIRLIERLAHRSLLGSSNVSTFLPSASNEIPTTKKLELFESTFGILGKKDADKIEAIINGAFESIDSKALA